VTGVASVPEIDVDQLMAQIRETARQRRTAARGIDSTNAAPSDGHGASTPTRLDACYDFRTVQFTSHRRVVGRLIVAIKQILRKLLTPILERQAGYNAASACAIESLEHHIHQEVATVRELLASQSRELSETESRLRMGLTAQSREILTVREALSAQVEALRNEVIATESRLRTGLTAQSQEILTVRETLSAQVEALRDEVIATQSRLQAVKLRLQDDVADQARALQAMRESSEAGSLRASRAERTLRRILYVLNADQRPDQKAAAKVGGEKLAIPVSELEPGFDYAGFEERFRGGEVEIKERQRRYVEYFKGREHVIDIGCGRGEFLELLREHGIRARGVDLDLDMVLLCRDKGLDVVREDVFAHLDALGDDSIHGVFAAQLIEHFPPLRTIDLVRLCHRKLAPGGVLLVETPNPTCLMVFATSFYMDLSHFQPLHPEAIKFLFEAVGFHQVELTFSSPVNPSMRIPALHAAAGNFEQFNQGIDRLNSLLFGFQDYAVIGHKAAVVSETESVPASPRAG
jgi:SAM-dependent methyltransferase